MCVCVFRCGNWRGICAVRAIFEGAFSGGSGASFFGSVEVVLNLHRFFVHKITIISSEGVHWKGTIISLQNHQN